MTRKETIKYLGLDNLKPDKESETESIYSLNQTQYGRVFTLLDRNESDWNEDSEELDNSDEDVMSSKYYSKTGELTLEANLEEDTYKIIITDNKE